MLAFPPAWGTSPDSSCPLKGSFAQVGGISSFVAFTSTSTRWAECPPVDESDSFSAPTSRGEPGAQRPRQAGGSSSSRSGEDQRPEPWKTNVTSSPTMSRCPCWASAPEPRRGMCEQQERAHRPWAAQSARCYRRSSRPGVRRGMDLGSDPSANWVTLSKSLACSGLQFSLL